MEWVLRYGGVQTMEMYNCSAHTPQEWSELLGEVHKVEGIFSIIYGIIVELLYIPCLLAISSREFMQHSCFKFMSFLAYADMMSLVVNSFISGYLMMTGGVFCSNPVLVYFSGSVGLGVWCTSCVLGLLLVLSRLIDIFHKQLGEHLFEGNRTYIWISGAFLYGIGITLFTPPAVFHSKYHAWFFDPFIYANRTLEYQNWFHVANNVGVVGFTGSLYFYFLVVLGKKLRQELGSKTSCQRAQKQILVQSAVIGLVTFVASFTYVMMNFVLVPVILIKAAHYLWMFHDACPVLIYLGMNRTIRNAAINKIMLKKVRNPFTRGSVTGPQAKNSVGPATGPNKISEELSGTSRA